MSDVDWMQRALVVARSVLGTTAPNPAVGAVLVRNGVLLGQGATLPAGGDHAEVVALKDARAAGHDTAGATLYSTLEPCCHHGRTGPCTEAILEARVQRVVVGTLDPFAAVHGAGVVALLGAGVDVRTGVCQEAAERQVLGFAKAVALGVPEVTAKVAMSLDGRIATSTGESQWITGEEARLHGHGLRANHDAILVGIGTVLADNPRLTCRHPSRSVDQGPVPVVLDTQGRIPADAALFDGPRRPVLIWGPDAPQRLVSGDVVRVAVGEDGRLNIRSALAAIVKLGHHRVLVEGGGMVHRSLLDSDLVDTLRIYLAGVVLPGGRSWVGGPPEPMLAKAKRLSLVSTNLVGRDVALEYRRPLVEGNDPFYDFRER